MAPLFPPCRHRREPRCREVYYCRSPKLIGARLVTPDFCGQCPFRDHEAPGDLVDLPPVHPGMPAEEMADLLEGPPGPWPPGWEDWPVTHQAHAIASERFLARLPRYPRGRFRGRGIVIAGGGARFFPSVYVTVRAARAVGCRLPLQVWYLGSEGEMPPRHADVLAAFDVECVDGDAVRARHPCRLLNGWELKVFALLHSPFEEVLLLDADCYPVRDPTLLFEGSGYREAGAIFWPDLPGGPPLDWGAFGVAPAGPVSVESGQVVVHKQTCWKPLQLAWWYNDHSDWSYLHGYGDKHTFEVAWARCGFPVHRFAEKPGWSRHSFLQAGPDGRVLFVHRCRDKFRFGRSDYLTPQHLAANQYHPALPLERECFGWLADLAREFALPAETVPMPTFPVPPSPPGRPPAIRAWMYSCPERRQVLEQTLARLRATDWRTDPVVVWDDAAGSPSAERIAETAHRMLALAAREESDYDLFLEDDLLFNLSLRHNLEHWPPLREGRLWMGSLYNPGLAPAQDGSRHDLWEQSHLPLAPDGFYGSQAMVLSRDALQVVLHQWDQPVPYDLRLAAIARQNGRAILAHSPSLVQHVPVPSTRGGRAHRAIDFDPFFRCSRPCQPDLPAGCGVLTAADENFFVGFRLLADSLPRQVPLAVFDAGLNSRQRRFAQERATVLPMPSLLFPPGCDPAWWAAWNKPAYFYRSPFRYSLWIDSDCLVTGNLEPLFRRVAQAGPLVVSHWLYGDYSGGNQDELYAREPCPRFPPHMTVNTGVVGLGPDPASRKVLDCWAYLVYKAGRDESLRNLIGWVDEGALHWALQKAEDGNAWHDRRTWNCLHPLFSCDSSEDFFRRLQPHPGDVIIHVAGRPKYWRNWSDKELFEV